MKDVKCKLPLSFNDSNSRKIFNNKHLLNIYHMAGIEPFYNSSYSTLPVPAGDRYSHLQASDEYREFR